MQDGFQGLIIPNDLYHLIQPNVSCMGLDSACASTGLDGLKRCGLTEGATYRPD